VCAHQRVLHADDANDYRVHSQRGHHAEPQDDRKIHHACGRDRYAFYNPFLLLRNCVRNFLLTLLLKPLRKSLSTSVLATVSISTQAQNSAVVPVLKH
jgi:hypothetical protein